MLPRYDASHSYFGQPLKLTGTPPPSVNVHKSSNVSGNLVMM